MYDVLGDDMQTKLTLRMEDELINMAKSVAEKKGKSLSKMVSDYFKAVIKKELSEEIIELPPNVKSLYGALSDSKIDESDYKKYLEGKYL
jgi:TRAP-type mannitol/chloroaromatic compound transport system substrate-binding protein